MNRRESKQLMFTSEENLYFFTTLKGGYIPKVAFFETPMYH